MLHYPRAIYFYFLGRAGGIKIGLLIKFSGRRRAIRGTRYSLLSLTQDLSSVGLLGNISVT